MEAIMRILSLTVLAMMFALAGCAATEERSTLASVSERDVVDTEKVRLINYSARERGVGVIWIHLPTKRAALAGRD
jgi:ABC-type uncharacterized transport system auxiliary subunit